VGMVSLITARESNAIMGISITGSQELLVMRIVSGALGRRRRLRHGHQLPTIIRQRAVQEKPRGRCVHLEGNFCREEDRGDCNLVI
jgi:hypothetical protein